MECTRPIQIHEGCDGDCLAVGMSQCESCLLLQLCFSLNRAAAAARVPALLPGRGVTDTRHSASVRRGRGEAATRLLSAAAGTITAVRGLRDTAEIPCTAPPTTCMSPDIATVPNTHEPIMHHA